MTLIRWTPVATPPRFDPFSGPFFRRFADEDEEDEVRAVAPNADVKETENEVVLAVELPGLSNEDVNIAVENGVLTLSGERKPEAGKDDRYHLRECVHGNFLRRFTLGEDLDEEKISAKMEKGVLTVTFPKKEAVKPRKIEVTVK